MKIWAQTRHEGGRMRCASRRIFPLPMVPCASSAAGADYVSSHSCVTRVSRSPLREKRTSNNANIVCRSPFPTCRAEREENSRKHKSHYYTVLQQQNTPPKMQLRPLFTNPSLDQLLTTIGRGVARWGPGVPVNPPW